MAELNNQPRSVDGGTATFNDHPGSPLNVVPHNHLPDFAFNEDEDVLDENRVVEDPKPISKEFPALEVFRSENENVDDSASDLHQNGTNDDEDGVQNCIQADEEFYVHHTPNGTRMWCPNVPTILRPVVGCVYETWKDVFRIYKEYAVYSGFSIRKGQTKRWKGVLVSLMGGHHNVRGTPTDFKNWSQSVRLYVGDRDAQLLIDHLKERSESLPDFYYEFVVEKGQLRLIFWADEISKINYEVFGDVLAFDATYHTNKYIMIFVPFIGVDNHKQCVTFGAGLLFNETTESYKWLLESFLKAHKKQPKLVLTDQDPSMKAAILEVFIESRHRLCMWHIMKKLPIKIAGDLLQNSELRALMHRLVWSIHMKPSIFETRWQLLMEEYGLQDHDWLNDMYSIRDQWVPAYFRDIPMCCLMKTTSRSESSNSSFKVHSSSANTLVQFMLCYETRIDNQRYRQRVAEFKTSSSVFMDTTELAIEKHAFELYTHAIFTEVRKEIYKGKLSCYIVNTEDCDDVLLCESVGQTKQCNQHIHGNLLSFVVKRWTRDVLPKSLFSVESRYGIDTRPQAAARSQILEIVTEYVDALRSDVGGLSSFAEQIKELKCKLLNGGPVDDDEANNDNYAAVEELLGVSLDGDVTLNNPDGVRNKGCGKCRRSSRPAQDAMSNSAVKPPKTPRLCRICMKYVIGHDSRNCKKKKKKKQSANEDDDSSSGSQEST
ncbi:uncharacterized protein LOC110870660 [Helianthus annuus]|uniref:uncharacterized protein LOC110870660 n=1 Tax=Helianthus annuus TaxID=4232 RepID=UPI000B8F060F|nr:uncharacterized protein LOC110870660 [Helianthus annuus]